MPNLTLKQIMYFQKPLNLCLKEEKNNVTLFRPPKVSRIILNGPKHT